MLMSLFDNFNANYRKLNRMIKNNDIAGIVKLLNTIDEDEKDYYLIEGLRKNKL